MLRTVISLDIKDKNWLDKQARRSRVTMTEVVRRAIKKYRQETDIDKKGDLEKLLKKTKNIWGLEDGLEYQRKIRSDWN